MSEGDNLNNYLNTGFYYVCQSSARAATLINSPFDDSAFYLHVYKLSETGNYYLQIALRQNGTVLRTRHCSNGTWQDWVDRNANFKRVTDTDGPAAGFVPSPGTSAASTHLFLTGSGWSSAITANSTRNGLAPQSSGSPCRYYRTNTSGNPTWGAIDNATTIHTSTSNVILPTEGTYLIITHRAGTSANYGMWIYLTSGGSPVNTDGHATGVTISRLASDTTGKTLNCKANTGDTILRYILL